MHIALYKIRHKFKLIYITKNNTVTVFIWAYIHANR